MNRVGPIRLSIVVLQLLCSTPPRTVAASDASTSSVGAEDLTLPQLRKSQAADWPNGETPRLGVRVTFSITVSERGQVTEAQVAESAGPRFDKAARLAIMTFEFEPARKGGQPIAG